MLQRWKTTYSQRDSGVNIQDGATPAARMNNNVKPHGNEVPCYYFHIINDKAHEKIKNPQLWLVRSFSSTIPYFGNTGRPNFTGIKCKLVNNSKRCPSFSTDTLYSNECWTITITANFSVSSTRQATRLKLKKILSIEHKSHLHEIESPIKY